MWLCGLLQGKIKHQCQKVNIITGIYIHEEENNPEEQGLGGRNPYELDNTRLQYKGYPLY